MMGLADILLLSVALSMDCFTVSIVNGVIVGRRRWRIILSTAVLFGLFQGLMPLAGWSLTSRFAHYIEAYDHWVAFALLTFLGVRMIADARRPDSTLPSAPLRPGSGSPSAPLRPGSAPPATMPAASAAGPAASPSAPLRPGSGSPSATMPAASAAGPAASPSADPSRLSVQLLQAVATSIDALAVGISMAALGYRSVASLLYPTAVIAAGSFLLSIAGFLLGVRFGSGIRRRLQPALLGGIILLLIGIKVLLSHLFDL